MSKNNRIYPVLAGLIRSVCHVFMSLAVSPSRPEIHSRLPVASALAVLSFTLAAHLCIWFADRWEPKLLLFASLACLFWLARPVSSWIDSRRSHVRRWVHGWAVTCGFTLVAALALIAIGWLTGAWQGLKTIGMFDKSLPHWFSVKLPTVALQQILLQLLLVPALARAFNSKQVVIGCAVMVFASLHFPNPVLIVLTAAAGWMWVELYFRYRQIAPIVASHFLLAVLAAGVCGEYVLNLRVGPACAKLFPHKLELQARTLLVFPAALSGCVERLVQHGDRLILEGWVCDGLHGAPPQALGLKIGKQMVGLTDVEYARGNVSDWPNAHQSGCNLRQMFRFRGSVAVGHIPDQWPAQLYAQNVNGWYSRLGRMGAIAPQQLASQDRPTLLFPTEVDGRIHRIVARGQSLQVGGWVADIKQQSIPQRLWLHVDGHWRGVDLGPVRRPTPYIAESYQTDKFGNCGFHLSLAEPGLIHAVSLEFYVQDKQGLMHRVPLNETASVQLANIQDKGNRTRLR